MRDDQALRNTRDPWYGDYNNLDDEEFLESDGDEALLNPWQVALSRTGSISYYRQNDTTARGGIMVLDLLSRRSPNVQLLFNCQPLPKVISGLWALALFQPGFTTMGVLRTEGVSILLQKVYSLKEKLLGWVTGFEPELRCMLRGQQRRR